MVGHELFDVMESRRILLCRREPESWLDAVEVAVIGLDCLELFLFTSGLLLLTLTCGSCFLDNFLGGIGGLVE